MFQKECKKICRSFVFWVYALVMFVAYATQFVPEMKLRMAEPAKGQESYGTMAVERPDILMPAAVENLVGEYLQGYYAAWPLSFYKEIHLKEAERIRMAAIIEELTGLTEDELDFREAVWPEYTLPEALTYERFRELMREADELLGGGSCYCDERLLSQFSQVSMTYEDALAEYQANVTKDALGEVYVRLYCDYMGIFLAIMPVFAGAAFWDLDRRAKANALIYSRSGSSIKIAGIRYMALLCCTMLPFFPTFLHMVIRLNGLYREIGIVWGRAVFLAICWLLPELMFVTAFAVLLTELASPLLAVLVQGLVWFWSVQMTPLSGSVTQWTLLIRHNLLGGNALFHSQWNLFLQNRICYFILALGCIGIEMLVFERKRRGWKFMPTPKAFECIIRGLRKESI